MAGILELLVASLDRVAAGGRGAEHVDQWYRYLANHEIQVHLALNLWHLDAVSRLCSHLSLPYEGITVCCVTDLNDIFINVMLSIFCQERLPKIWLDDINMRNVDIRGFDDWHGIWPRCPLAPWRHWHKMPPLLILWLGPNLVSVLHYRADWTAPHLQTLKQMFQGNV